MASGQQASSFTLRLLGQDSQVVSDHRRKSVQHVYKQMGDEVLEQLKSTQFNHWSYKEDEQLINLSATIFEQLGLAEFLKLNLNDQEDAMWQFLYAVRDQYNDNPFHNFTHGFTVLQMMYCLITGCYLTDGKIHTIDILALCIAALCHDLDHPGLSNAFQVAAQTDLALRYNDSSVLENHHCATTFRILTDPCTNIIQNLSYQEYIQLRVGIINCIMATDVSKQRNYIERVNGYMDGTFSWSNQEHKLAAMAILMKASDVSLEVRPMSVSKPWVDKIYQEFANESQMFRQLQIEIPAHLKVDGKNVQDINKAQRQFILHVLLPLFQTLSKLFPQTTDKYLGKVQESLQLYHE
ncbi:hypothetical protein MIR68_008545 [Amoeboaphelidium protococcarum]|nr:hypothetical protein MIR68_008545 [Amoeboaphelidium protococcarum]